MKWSVACNAIIFDTTFPGDKGIIGKQPVINILSSFAYEPPLL